MASLWVLKYPIKSKSTRHWSTSQPGISQLHQAPVNQELCYQAPVSQSSRHQSIIHWLYNNWATFHRAIVRSTSVQSLCRITSDFRRAIVAVTSIRSLCRITSDFHRAIVTGTSVRSLGQILVTFHRAVVTGTSVRSLCRITGDWVAVTSL